MTTPLFNSSLFSLESAWEAPRILKAPIFWKFSHLKKRLIFGLAGDRPSLGVPTSPSAVCGDEAMSFRAEEVMTGVRWMCDSMSLSALMTEERVIGSIHEESVILNVSALKWSCENCLYFYLIRKTKFGLPVETLKRIDFNCIKYPPIFGAAARH